MLKSVFSIMFVLLTSVLLSGCLNAVPSYPPYYTGCNYSDWVCNKVRYDGRKYYPRYYAYYGGLHR